MKISFNKFSLLIIILFSAVSSTVFAEPLLPEPEVIEKAEDFNRKIPVQVIKKISLPKGYHEGLYYDGKNIWVGNGKGMKTWVVDTTSGEVISEIIPAGSFTEAITDAGDGKLWMSDWKEKKLFKVTIKNNEMVAEHEISLDPAHPTGAVWTGDGFYVLTWTRGGGTTYHLLRFDPEGNVLWKKQMKGISEPSQLAWDGTNLWVTSWFDKRVYKLDVNAYEILGYFKSPAKKSTGIVWDGKYLWITGSYASLYQVEVLSDISPQTSDVS